MKKTIDNLPHGHKVNTNDTYSSPVLRIKASKTIDITVRIYKNDEIQ